MASRDRHVFVYNQTKETFLALQVKVADSIWGRMVGLLGLRSLEPSSRRVAYTRQLRSYDWDALLIRRCAD